MRVAFFLTMMSVPVAPPEGRAATPASRPAGRIVDFQPGIRIDFAKKHVEVAARVVLREGVLELFACSRGTREHESVVAIASRPLHVFEALGLIGLTPGTPPA